jgi:hypothetical protein
MNGGCAIEPQGTVMTNLRRGLFAALALVIVGLPTAAFAEFKPSAELRSACMSDVFKLCSSHLLNMDSVVACLQQRKAEASPKCRAQYDAESKTAAQK